MDISRKKKFAWVIEIIEAERYGAPEGSTRTSKGSKPYSSYVALMCDLVDQEPTSYEEAAQKKEWVEAMTKEYQPIMKNDVWDIEPKPENKSVVSSKWIYKIKHVANGSIEKYKERFVARGFSKKEGIYYEIIFSSSKVHFLQNHQGSFFHDEMRLTPDGCKDILP